MNRSLFLGTEETSEYLNRCLSIEEPIKNIDTVKNRTVYGDTFSILERLPSDAVDLVFVDPPYNMDKVFGQTEFKNMDDEEYEKWLDSWISELHRILKVTGTIYVCGDWRSSSGIYRVLKAHFKVRNRITFEREKGRGAKTNWKNASEDIWFATKSNEYYFDVDSVKLKRKVIAPYRNEVGQAKDWESSDNGKFRLTHPSNLWTDITIPFWSMPENTNHPTQKPEKLVAKAILASSKIGDIVLDPFLGSGTTSVVAKKLGRNYIGIEMDPAHCAIAEKRLELVEDNCAIQGYFDGVFWERNSNPNRDNAKTANTTQPVDELFFGDVNEK